MNAERSKKLYFEAHELAVGYNGSTLIHDIEISLEKGSILTLIGPNGSGKSTILKTITKQLDRIKGSVLIDGQEILNWQPKQMARKAAVVLTERIKPELMTAWDVVALGRYPYTNMLGMLTQEDKEIVRESLEKVNALDIAAQEFLTLSDGQKQRIVLARAICQRPEIIILDEPTAFLDIWHKTELLDILRQMAYEQGITVIMSLHEIDLAAKVSDYLMCVKGDRIAAFGSPEEVLKTLPIEELYGMDSGSYNVLFGSVELKKTEGEARVFVVAGNGCGIPFYRALQRKKVPFSTGILFENDTDTQVAVKLAVEAFITPAFELPGDEIYRAAVKAIERCDIVIDAGTPKGSLNEMNSRLIAHARDRALRVINEICELEGV